MKEYITRLNDMMEKYFNLGQAVPKKDEDHELLELIRQAHREWQIALNNFNYCHENDMIDYSIYNIEAAEKKYICLLKRAQQENLSSDKIYNEMNGTQCTSDF